MELSEAAVTREHIKGLWESVRRDASNPSEGIYGPASISWKVNRESAVFLGAGRAAILQLAHPWVAAALDQHSNLRADPLARFHNTFRVVFTMIFGTLDQALAASRHLYQLHTRIQGELPARVAGYVEGSPYEANEVNALLWVYATLVESALRAYDCVLSPLSVDEREAYYKQSWTLAALFGIPASALPPDWAGFQMYGEAMLSSDKLGVNALSREMAHRVLHGRGSWVPVPRWYRALTTAWLPPRFRDEFSLDFGKREQDAFAAASRWLPRIYRTLPGRARFVGPYQEAQSRLADREADVMTRVSNRFWMGVPRMMFGNAEIRADPE
ncbi:MAG TPA: oxygenase MpaB family protein [Candidatus Acidoferrales bacterium]|nr:oxygenase MpaB family protein [Candidatus Acidoferrales bacterium]